MKITLISNPVAGRSARKRTEAAAELIRRRGHELRLLYTEKRGDAELYARNAAEAAEKLIPDMIIAAGGDGTLNEVINGLAGSSVPLAIVPAGTTNVLAKELDIPESAERAVKRIFDGKSHKVSLGKIAFEDGNVRFFILMAGVGYDACSTRGVSPWVKRLSGKGAYILSGLNVLISWRPDAISVTIDGKPYSCYSLIVCNSRKYAGHFGFAPDADITDPHLYAYLMHGRRRSDILRYTAGVLSGRHLRFKDITYLRADNIEVGNALVQIDGDYCGSAPASISISPGALCLIY